MSRHNSMWKCFKNSAKNQENKAGKMQSTKNQLKHGKGHGLCDNGTRGVVSIHHTPRTIIVRTALPSML